MISNAFKAGDGEKWNITNIAVDTPETPNICLLFNVDYIEDTFYLKSDYIELIRLKCSY